MGGWRAERAGGRSPTSLYIQWREEGEQYNGSAFFVASPRADGQGHTGKRVGGEGPVLGYAAVLYDVNRARGLAERGV